MYREEVLKEIIDNQFLFADRRGPVPSPCLTGLQGKKPACRQAWGKGRATATRGRAAACSPAPCKEAQACPFGGRPAPPCGRTCAGKRAEVCPHGHRPEGSGRGKSRPATTVVAVSTPEGRQALAHAATWHQRSLYARTQHQGRLLDVGLVP